MTTFFILQLIQIFTVVNGLTWLTKNDLIEINKKCLKNYNSIIYKNFQSYEISFVFSRSMVTWLLNLNLLQKILRIYVLKKFNSKFTNKSVGCSKDSTFIFRLITKN